MVVVILDAVADVFVVVIAVVSVEVIVDVFSAAKHP